MEEIDKKCKNYWNGNCSNNKNELIGACDDYPNCYYKQLKRLEQENEELSKLIRGTKDYTEVCSECKDEVTIYPNISGRTDYTQNEVECRTLAQIITRENNLEQENEELKARLRPLEDSYFKGLSSIEIAGLAKKSIRITTYNRQLETALEDISEIANQTIIDYTDIAKNNEKLKALDLRSRIIEIQEIITEAIGE